jgi:hypothetical protein
MLAPLIILILLPPLPYLFLLGFLLLDRVRPETGAATTLVHQALLQRTRAARLPLWLSLEESVQGNHPRDLPDKSPDLTAEHGLLRLYDVKTLALGLDAAMLAWLAVRLASTRPAWAAGIGQGIEGVIHLSVGVGLAASLVMGAHFLWVACRLPGRFRHLDRQPSMSYMARSQLSLGIGLHAGYGLAMEMYGWNALRGCLGSAE